MSYNPESSDRSLDGLLLDGLNLDDKKRVVTATTKPSLLSSLLAGERVHLQQHHQHQAAARATDEAYHDHPEPELLASSVGKDMDGRLIPSSSTISLLSLNNQHHVSPQAVQIAQFVPQHADDDQHYLHQSPKVMHDRKSGLRSRNSVTHLAHKRFENYQRLSSPLPQQQHPLDHATTQSIPINVKYITPDSPNLDPTSLNGSPSRFWLSSQTPPMSLSNSYKKMSLLNLQQLQNNTQARKHSHAQPVTIPKRGSDSPILIPVQTPSEDAPMTPLYLSNDPNANYFNLQGNIDEEEEERTDEMNIEE